jgi:hypothetical protein
MKVLVWLLRILTPLVVLYAIGYYIAGFSALSLQWLLMLSILIAAGNWIISQAFGKERHSVVKPVLNFVVVTLVIFMMTYLIEGGQVPLSGSLLVALIISLLQMLIPEVAVG